MNESALKESVFSLVDAKQNQRHLSGRMEKQENREAKAKDEIKARIKAEGETDHVYIVRAQNGSEYSLRLRQGGRTLEVREATYIGTV